MKKEKDNSKWWMILLLITLIILSGSALISAEEIKDHAKDTNYDLIISSNKAAYCSLMYINYPDGSKTLYNINLTKNLQSFSLNLASGNYSQLGKVCHGIYCASTDDSITGDVCVNVKNEIDSFNAVQLTLYIFVLLICIVGIFLSIKLITKAPIQDDDVSMYRQYEENKFMYYIQMIKSKGYILGSFGVYLLSLLFLTILSSLFLNMGMIELNQILKYAIIVVSWGLIPFALFWLVYIIITFYKTTERILRHEFGGFRSNRR